MILRDDHDADWKASADSTLERRVYPIQNWAQNWRADVVALMADNGRVLERTCYEAYGTPHGSPAADLTGSADSNSDFFGVPDGVLDSVDSSYYLTLYSTSDARADLSGSSNPASGAYGWPDGTIDSVDYFYYLAIYAEGATARRGVLSQADLRNRKGYAGYEWDPGTQAATMVFHVRNRVLMTETGRWSRRDPLGYVDGMSLYAYVSSRPIGGIDPSGTAGNQCTDIASMISNLQFIAMTQRDQVIPNLIGENPLINGACDPVWRALYIDGRRCALDGGTPVKYPPPTCPTDAVLADPRVRRIISLIKEDGGCFVLTCTKFMDEGSGTALPTWPCALVFVYDGNDANVIAHELYHVWQFTNRSLPRDCRSFVDMEYEAYKYEYGPGIASPEYLCESACRSAQGWARGIACLGTSNDQCVSNCIDRHESSSHGLGDFPSAPDIILTSIH